LESAFGKIEQSNWVEAAEQWKKELPWLQYSQQIALEILEHLDANDISQRKFAEMMGVSPQLVNKWLKGKENFTLETIAKMEFMLDISLIQVAKAEEVEELVSFHPLQMTKPLAYEKPQRTQGFVQLSPKRIQINFSYQKPSSAKYYGQ
jgi:transcriptional regulator with XRE-family HTH domain